MVIICGIVVLVSGVIGYAFSNKLTKKATFYKNMLSFCEKLEINIAFLQNTLPEILSETIKNQSTEIAGVISSYKEYNENKCSNLNFPNYLNEEEKDEIEKFFKSIGLSNAESEQKLILGFKAKIERNLKQAEENKTKNGPLIFKMATFIGLALAIIIY